MEEELKNVIDTATEIEDMPDFGEDTPTEKETEVKTEETKTEKKEETLSTYEKVILSEMERRAGEGDELLATALGSKDKSIKECFGYITEQARKQAINNCAMIEDSVVFGWAHHYYIESKETIDAEMKPKVKPKADTAPVKPPKKGKEKPKAVSNTLDITKAIISKVKDGGKREKKKDNLKAGFVPMERPDTLKDAKKGSREQAKSVEQMDLFADFFALV